MAPDSDGSFFIRVPYCMRDLKGDPNLENYPDENQPTGPGPVVS